MTLTFHHIGASDDSKDKRIYELEHEVLALRRQIAELRAAVEVLLAPAHDEGDVNIR
jgi:hypothetical protein